MEHVQQDQNQEEHSAILQAVVRLDTLFNLESPHQRLRPDLVELSEVLIRHFRAEEASWLHATAGGEYPRAAALIERLMAEHGEMLERLERLAASDAD